MTTTFTEPATLAGFTREGVEALSRAKNEPEWVLAARLSAFETYQNLPAPARTDEEWRRTSLRGLKLDRLAPFAGARP